MAKAQRFFSELPGDSCKNYSTLKAALLTAYAVVSKVHRKTFRNLSKRNEETFSDFSFLLSNHFKRWTDGENAYDDIEHL